MYSAVMATTLSDILKLDTDDSMEFSGFPE